MEVVHPIQVLQLLLVMQLLVHLLQLVLHLFCYIHLRQLLKHFVMLQGFHLYSCLNQLLELLAS